MRLLREDMQNHHPSFGRRHVDSPSNASFGLDSKLPELTLKMPGMRRTKFLPDCELEKRIARIEEMMS